MPIKRNQKQLLFTVKSESDDSKYRIFEVYNVNTHYWVHDFDGNTYSEWLLTIKDKSVTAIVREIELNIEPINITLIKFPFLDEFIPL